jgi:rhodanese-related sulfurtransferase
MKGAIVTILIAVFSLVIGGISVEKSAAEDVPRISKEELKPKLGNPDMIILDVRHETQWKASNRHIIGAFHENPEEVKAWADKYPKDKTLVLY